MKYTRPRGTQDVTPAEIDRWRNVERAFEEVFDRFGYRGIRTPIFESTDLFTRAVGEQTDIVAKEMYTFTDRGGRSLTLRPENTASVIRAYIENGMHRLGGVQRLWYIGPMFRYDRPQAGRYRQFHQVGAEAIGTGSPGQDVEMIQVVVESLESLGFKGIDVRLNSVGSGASRARYTKILLEAIRGIAGELAPADLDRFTKNPLRVFDSKEHGQELRRRLPAISAHLVGEDADHFATVKESLAGVGVPFTEDPYLVRGLDYYTRTVFEIFHGDYGAQSALCGGGRYDDLVRECGGPPTPAVGFSAGLERIVAALPKDSPAAADRGEGIRYYVVCVGAGAQARALRLAKRLRTLGSAQVDLSGRAKKTQLAAAVKKKAPFAVVVEESEPTRVVWHDLVARSETTVADESLETIAREVEARSLAPKGGPA